MGDPEHPFTQGFACGKAALSLKQVTHPERIRYPMVRTSRGFERISLEKALDIAASAVYGRNVYRLDYSGHMGILSRFFHQRLFRALRAPELTWDICSTSGDKALEEATGSTWGVDIDAIKQSDLVLIWGANVHHSSIHAFRWAADAKMVFVIDPVRTETADAFCHIPVKPAGDVALVCQLLRELKERGIGIPLNWLATEGLEDISGVDRRVVELLVDQLISSERPFVFIGYGFQRQWNGGMAVRLIASMMLSLGKGPRYYFDRPYSGLNVDYVRMGQRGLNTHKISWTQLSLELSEERNGAFFVMNANPLNTLPGRSRLKDIMSRKTNLVVVHELFMTETAAVADLVIPAKHYLEFEDVIPSYGHSYLGFNEKGLEPPVQSLSNMELARELAAALHMQDADMYEDDRSLINGALKPLGIDYETLKVRKIVQLPEPLGPQFHEWPSAEDIRKALVAPNERGKFLLLTPVGQLRIHSQYANIVDLVPIAEMNRADCERLGISDGAAIMIKNERGSINVRCRFSSRVMEGVIRLEHGWWQGIDEASVNDLTSCVLQTYGGSQLMWTWVDVEGRQ